MTAPNLTTPVVYKEIGRLPGYRFGDDGSIWSRVKYRGRLSDHWHLIRGNRTSKAGHIQVTLYVNTIPVRYCAHRLILEAFVGPCPPGMECCHRDGNPANNRPENLRWGTRAENAADSIRHGTKPMGSRHHRAKLMEADIPVIRRLRSEGMTLSKIAERFGVTRPQIGAVISGRNWTHVV